MYQQIKRFLKDQKGQDFAEYAILLGALAAAAGIIISQFGPQLESLWNRAVAVLGGG
ncbi:MAG: Flp family type IVb pilin [Anaerolineae bacterium]|nr:Flp family type IVb pilin [Anaerolineae bacterium]